MKKNHYKVIFAEGKEIFIHAWTEEQAKILAQARKIEEMSPYLVLAVIKQSV